MPAAGYIMLQLLRSIALDQKLEFVFDIVAKIIVIPVVGNLQEIIWPR
jgi:hypothetical protein